MLPKTGSESTEGESCITTRQSYHRPALALALAQAQALVLEQFGGLVGGSERSWASVLVQGKARWRVLVRQHGSLEWSGPAGPHSVLPGTPVGETRP